jgi:ribonuclease P protein subunit POP4
MAVQSLFLTSRGDSAEDRLRGKTVMLDNTRTQTQQQRHEVRQRRQLLRKRRRLGVSLPEESDRKAMREDRGQYRDYLCLHEAWQQYAEAVMSSGAPTSAPRDRGDPIAGVSHRLFLADLHGARIRVVESRCGSDVGIEGIVIRESKSALHLIDMKDAVKIIPKRDHVFGVNVGEVQVRLYGNGLVDRDRALNPHKGARGPERFLKDASL